jgi:hypothetical protein
LHRWYTLKNGIKPRELCMTIENFFQSPEFKN